jgi:hypothetical protein
MNDIIGATVKVIFDSKDAASNALEGKVIEAPINNFNFWVIEDKWGYRVIVERFERMMIKKVTEKEDK